ncbi:LacI family DNA-binding transcriptional regulator [Oceaniradius stylonematis]|uniref:LacI family DNA-binding transcriptional regulator n=1 Tax=Oceaniradius stylonematis TaxID=2184161 RepID=UPI00273D71B1|nr:LacI family DNA-binding transcriptional regulator [Oceaniradius stylonematis]
MDSDRSDPPRGGPGKVTSHDVAARAGVSQPTVSRVFSSDPKVSPDLARRVRRAADELGYRPNRLARSLITGRSRTIGLVLAYLDNPFYAEAIAHLSAALEARGYHIMVRIASNLAEEVDGVVDDMVDHQVDGIILASVSMSNALTGRLRDAKIPFVLFNRGQEDASLATVTSANFDGGRRAAHFLAAGGHERIAHISGWQKSLNGRDRQAGFLAGLAENGLEPIDIIDSHYSRDIAAAATRELFKGTIRPDAIFAGNDHMAFAVTETLRFGLGLKVPGDVSVIGYDDVAMAAWPSFDLTTLRQPARRMAESASALLLDLIAGKAPKRNRIEIDSELIVRGSARIPPGWKRSARTGPSPNGALSHAPRRPK